jgi:hypothetical protein
MGWVIGIPRWLDESGCHLRLNQAEPRSGFGMIALLGANNGLQRLDG